MATNYGVVIFERFRRLFVTLSPWFGAIAIIAFFAQTVLQENKSNEMSDQLNKMEDHLRGIRAQLSKEMRVETRNTETNRRGGIDTASVDRVYPFIRYANQLENYDGSTGEAGNENRVLLDSSPPVRLHFNRYSKDNPAFFDFGVYNHNEKAPIDNVIFSVVFLDKGLSVTPTGNWGTAISNESFDYQFQSINAQSGLNGNGALNVVFPHPGKYTIRLNINARGLGQKTRDLVVRVRQERPGGRKSN